MLTLKAGTDALMNEAEWLSVTVYFCPDSTTYMMVGGSSGLLATGGLLAGTA